jgi:hypothetical protein
MNYMRVKSHSIVSLVVTFNQMKVIISNLAHIINILAH